MSPPLRLPLIVGMLLGLMQTGLFFQLTFTLSSSFETYLLVTLCWLAGSAVGVYRLGKSAVSLQAFLGIGLLAYATCAVLLVWQPFNSRLWPAYGLLVIVAGIYPGVFFARRAQLYPARTLFLWENNGFVLGLVAGTLLFMVMGRWVLWGAPVVVAYWVWRFGEPGKVRHNATI
jgi:hypothetical protein